MHCYRLAVPIARSVGMRFETLIRGPSPIVLRRIQTSASWHDIDSAAKQIGASIELNEKEKKKKEYEEVVEQVRLMNEYFGQYIEEYYEEEVEELDEEEEQAFRKPTQEERLQALKELHERRFLLPSVLELGPERLVELLRHQRVKDIVCLQMPRDSNHTHEFVIICEPHNDRHAHSVIQNLRKFIKENYRYGYNNVLPPKIRNGPAPEWFTIDLRTVNLHLMSVKARRRYNLETLYAIDGSLEDDNLERYPDSMFPRPTVRGMNLEVDAEYLPPPITVAKTA